MIDTRVASRVRKTKLFRSKRPKLRRKSQDLNSKSIKESKYKFQRTRRKY